MLENCSLLVNSCDKYESVWPAYFGLMKKFWTDHPAAIYLNSETKTYQDPDLNIVNLHFPESFTWSERLYRCLEVIDTKYIIFSLEDFFLLDYVKQDKIEQCMEWMENNSSIAVCRLCVSNAHDLTEVWENSEFRLAPSSMNYRLDTQAALWNRETLMSFIDLKESPWQFEEIGTKRVAGTEKLFLWFYQPNDYDLTDMIFPYRINQKYGYGIAWGRWLWNNKKWLRDNGIYHVNYRLLGRLSKRSVDRRYKYLFNPKATTGIRKWIITQYHHVDQFEKVMQNIRIYGFKQGLKVSRAARRK